MTTRDHDLGIVDVRVEEGDEASAESDMQEKTGEQKDRGAAAWEWR
jgi:hypothetical protein